MVIPMKHLQKLINCSDNILVIIGEVVMYKNIVLIMFGIVIGVFINSYFDKPLDQKAYAKVAGMGASELKSDWDFRDAVTYVVQDRCKVSGEKIVCY